MDTRPEPTLLARSRREIDETLSVARQYAEAGLSVIPIRLDGTKAPVIKTWKEYQTRLPSCSEVADWFSSPAGIAIVCGQVSGGVEVLDFDHDAELIFPAWLKKLTPEIRGKLTVIETGGFGFHVIYRSELINGNEKIAISETDDEYRSEVIVESRGEGGYIVAPGSPLEVHRTGSPYVQVTGLPLPALPFMTQSDRVAMWRAAHQFDHRPKEEVLRPYVEAARRRREEPRSESDPSTPWADFSLRADWRDILGPHGWQSRDGVHWTRPGKIFGTSAKVNTARDGSEVLTVFSKSAGALSPTGSSRSFNKFSAFAALRYNGNQSEAAKAVRAAGYGSGRSAR